MVGLFSTLNSSEFAKISSNYMHIKSITATVKRIVTYEFADREAMLIVVVDYAASVVAAQQKHQ